MQFRQVLATEGYCLVSAGFCSPYLKNVRLVRQNAAILCFMSVASRSVHIGN